MIRDIKSYIDTCDICHQIKPVKHKPYGALSSSLAPQGSFTALTIDFITNIPLSEFHLVLY